jgi:hypothetical protein
MAQSSDIVFSNDITQAEFAKFSRVVAQAIYASPVEPARATGLLSFDIGAAVTAIPIDTDERWWQQATAEDFTTSGYLLVPRLTASKGFSLATIHATYARVQGSDAEFIGGALDVPIIRGNVALPELAIRGAYSQLGGVDVFDLKTYGAEVFISKGFGPLTPYGAIGRVRSDAEGTIVLPDDSAFVLTDQADVTRYTIGVRLSLVVPKIVVEATQAEERSYAAKVSFGF